MVEEYSPDIKFDKDSATVVLTPKVYVLTEENVRSIRPGYGLPPRHLKDVLGQRAAQDIKQGTPISWELIS